MDGDLIRLHCGFPRRVSPPSDVDFPDAALRVEEMPDWQDLRTAAHAIKTHTLLHLPHYLEQFERNCIAAGGHVHWARDADEGKVVAADQQRIAGKFTQESLGMKMAAHLFEHPKQYEAAQRMARMGQAMFEKDGRLVSLPGMAAGWTQFRDLRALPNQTFREWWKKNRGNKA